MRNIIIVTTCFMALITGIVLFTGSDSENVEVITFTDPVEIIVPTEEITMDETIVNVPVREIVMNEEVIDVSVQTIAMTPVEVTISEISVAEGADKSNEG